MATLTLSPKFTSLPPYQNEPFHDFTSAAAKAAMEQALAHVAAHLGQEYDMVVGGQRQRTEGKIISTNPANPAQVIGIHQRAEAEHAEAAIQAAHTAFLSWSRTNVADRADLLLRAAAAIRDRHLE